MLGNVWSIFTIFAVLRRAFTPHSLFNPEEGGALDTRNNDTSLLGKITTKSTCKQIEGVTDKLISTPENTFVGRRQI